MFDSLWRLWSLSGIRPLKDQMKRDQFRPLSLSDLFKISIIFFLYFNKKINIFKESNKLNRNITYFSKKNTLIQSSKNKHKYDFFPKNITKRKTIDNHFMLASTSWSPQNQQFTCKKSWHSKLAGKILWRRYPKAYPATEDALLQILEVERIKSRFKYTQLKLFSTRRFLLSGLSLQSSHSRLQIAPQTVLRYYFQMNHSSSFMSHERVLHFGLTLHYLFSNAPSSTTGASVSRLFLAMRSCSVTSLNTMCRSYIVTESDCTFLWWIPCPPTSSKYGEHHSSYLVWAVKLVQHRHLSVLRMVPNHEIVLQWRTLSSSESHCTVMHKKDWVSKV